VPLPVGHHCGHEKHLVSESPLLHSLSLKPKELSACINVLLLIISYVKILPPQKLIQGVLVSP